MKFYYLGNLWYWTLKNFILSQVFLLVVFCVLKCSKAIPVSHYSSSSNLSWNVVIHVHVSRIFKAVEIILFTWISRLFDEYWLVVSWSLSCRLTKGFRSSEVKRLRCPHSLVTADRVSVLVMFCSCTVCVCALKVYGGSFDQLHVGSKFGSQRIAVLVALSNNSFNISVLCKIINWFFVSFCHRLSTFFHTKRAGK